MTFSRILKFAMVSALFLQAACAAQVGEKNPPIENEELVFAANPEQAKGKQDTYASMARAAKYNVDVASHNLHKKIYNQNPNLKPQDIIENVINSNINDENRLYQASRVLEFAVIYAMANLSDNTVYVDNYFYEASSRHLALAAIRAHQDAWLASKKIKDIDRMAKQEQRIVDDSNAKEKRSGGLSDAEYGYRKNQEVLLLKMGELRKNLAFAMLEYGELTKIEPKDIELEGRRFYELEDFDKDYSIEVFQEAAVRNRKEFALAKEQVKSYAAFDVRRNVNSRYPLVSRLDINGLKVENAVYEQELYSKALKVANQLLDVVGAYKRLKAGSDKQQMLRQQAFDELGAAVLTQVEVSYQLVMLADADFDKATRTAADLKKEIRRLEKIYHPNNEDKLALLNAKVTMIEVEQRQAQIRAERAMALRSLYFNAGLSPFNKTLLKAPLKDVSEALKQAFNQNLIEMMSAVKTQMSALPQMEEEKGWAKGDNWLEKAVAQPTTVSQPKPVAANYKMMQLGSYEQKENAAADWQQMMQKFPALGTYQYQLEEADVLGQRRFRLVVSGEPQTLQSICLNLQNNGYECLLR